MKAFLAAAAALIIGWSSPAAAVELFPRPEIAASFPMERPLRLRFGFAAQPVIERPLVARLDTFLGDLRLEFPTMDWVESVGRLPDVRGVAHPVSAGVALFDRTDVTIYYMVAVPIVSF